ETEAEVQLNVEQYGHRPVEHLRRLGVFDGPALVAHAVHLTGEEIEILAEHGVKVSHNPGSNLKLGSGIAPIPEMLAAGLRPPWGPTARRATTTWICWRRSGWRPSSTRA